MNIAIILSGGIGTRLGTDIPKQYLEVNDKAIITYCLEKFCNHKDIDALVIAAADQWWDYIQDQIKTIRPSICIYHAQPGETRQLSILNSLKVAQQLSHDNDDWIIVHDAARPLVSERLITDCLNARHENFDGAMPVIPVKDTIYVSEDRKQITGLLDRSKLFAGQAPEAFNLNKYLLAHANLTDDAIRKINGSSEIAFNNDMRIKLIEGDIDNYKITDINDLERFKASFK